jgi:hypothetical protein
MVYLGCARVSDRAQHFGGLTFAAHGMATIPSRRPGSSGHKFRLRSSKSTGRAVGNQMPGSPVAGSRAIILHVFQSTSANTSFTSSS